MVEGERRGGAFGNCTYQTDSVEGLPFDPRATQDTAITERISILGSASGSRSLGVRAPVTQRIGFSDKYATIAYLTRELVIVRVLHGARDAAALADEGVFAVGDDE